MNTRAFQWMNNQKEWQETKNADFIERYSDEIPMVMLLPYCNENNNCKKYITWCDTHHRYEYVIGAEKENEYPHEFTTSDNCKISGWAQTVGEWQKNYDVKLEYICRWTIKRQEDRKVFVAADIAECKFYNNRFVIFNGDRLAKPYITWHKVGATFDLENNKIIFSPLLPQNSGQSEMKFIRENMPDTVINAVLYELTQCCKNIYNFEPEISSHEKGLEKVLGFMDRPFDLNLYYLRHFIGETDYQQIFSRTQTDTFSVLCRYYNIDEKEFLKERYKESPYSVFEYILWRNLGFSDDQAINMLISKYAINSAEWQNVDWKEYDARYRAKYEADKQRLILSQLSFALGDGKVQDMKGICDYLRNILKTDDIGLAKYMIKIQSAGDDGMKVVRLLSLFDNYLSAEQQDTVIKIGFNEEGKRYLLGEIGALKLPHKKLNVTVEELAYEGQVDNMQFYVIKYLDQVKVLQPMLGVSIYEVGRILKEIEEGGTVVVVKAINRNNDWRIAIDIKNGAVVDYTVSDRSINGGEKKRILKWLKWKNINYAAMKSLLIEYDYTYIEHRLTQNDIDALLNGPFEEVVERQVEDANFLTMDVESKDDFGSYDLYYLEHLSAEDVYGGYYQDILHDLRKCFVGMRKVPELMEFKDEKEFLKYMIPNGERLIDDAFAGVCEAQDALGAIYRDGKYVSRNSAQSMYWYKLASKDYAPALYHLAFWCLEMKLESAAIELISKAAMNGVRDAIIWLRNHHRTIDGMRV